ncbi:flagellar FliL protein [Melghiribacillus thermohalophilus]|uniref:Flagellar protein FliL n=1 Tax=Melghiribacillus thermohalophilus TaxID=1324956 RepID=A0A4R3NBF3_9BACI|nr:flagellar basal body-associated protein FliL [Melghiribacillus thermohalophilus]TCT26764.1 flagellar FliL protein [Melghiribacillus thermohalophilus]
MNQKAIKIMLSILISLVVLGIIAIVIVLNIKSDANADGTRNIDEILESSFETEEITTDIKDDRFVRVQFRIVTDSDDAKEELQKRDFQLKNILIKELSQMEEEDFKTGIENLEDTIKLKLNQLMNEGKVTDVYTTQKVIQ